jgi:predicted secreted protein
LSELVDGARSRGIFAHFAVPPTLDAVWLAAPLFVMAVCALLTPIGPYDYFWSLVQGRAMVQLGSIPTENLFLYTLPERAPFFDQPWLSQLAMAGAFAAGGHFANVAILAVLLPLSFSCSMDAALRAGAPPRAVALVALLGMPFVALCTGVRTQMFAFPCFAIFLWLLAADDLRPASRMLALAGTAAVWANLHGSVILAPLMVGAHTLGGLIVPAGASRGAMSKRGLATFSVVVLASWLNPRGPLVHVYALRLALAFQVKSSIKVEEWQPLSMGSPNGIGFAVLFALGVGWLVAYRRRIEPGLVAVYVSLALLSLTNVRFICWWAQSAIVALCPMMRRKRNDVAEAVPGADRRGPAFVNAVLLLFFAGAIVASLPGQPLFELAAREDRVPYADACALGRAVPVRMVQELARQRYTGRVFHNQAVGGYIEWVLAADAPKPVAFVDQRLELIPSAIWGEYFAISHARSDWKALLERHEVDALILEEHEDSGLIAALAGDREWRLTATEFNYRLYRRDVARVNRWL